MAKKVGGGPDLGQGHAAECAVKKVLKPSRYRPVVEHPCKGYAVSERRACRVARLHRGTYRYRGHRNPWLALRRRMREIAQARVRYGYRKIRVLLGREGWGVGKSRMQRLYKEEGLGLKQRPKRPRRAAEHRRERIRPTRPNQVWSLDFVADQMIDGRTFRVLTIVDVFTRESLAVEVGTR